MTIQSRMARQTTAPPTTEPEAFLLENRLVKRHTPAYTVKLRDDKDFLYVRIDRRHEFPALGLARRPRGATRGVTHIGPFASASSQRWSRTCPPPSSGRGIWTDERILGVARPD